MKTKIKHRCAMIRRGLYNYRAYCIQNTYLRDWVILDEEGGVAMTAKTLRAMKRKIDRLEACPAPAKGGNQIGSKPRKEPK
jgi:hypothetical protein